VGCGITALLPAPRMTDRPAAINSFEPLPIRMPSSVQPVNRASATVVEWGTNSGYRPHGLATTRRATSSLSSCGNS
jgi:hypothetical protein